MNRRLFLAGIFATATAAQLGCRGRQHAHVLDNEDQDMVGSHVAGAETFGPLIDGAVGNLLARHEQGPAFQPVGFGQTTAPPLRICFIGVENKSAEAIGDFKDQIYQRIDTQILQSPAFKPVNRRFVEAGLRESRLRPDELFLPQQMRNFSAVMEQQGQPFDILLYATLTSGTTRGNGTNYQRDYLLTLEMVNVKTGDYDKESASLRKGYHKTQIGKLKHYNPFTR
jgi:hypothetical protein